MPDRLVIPNWEYSLQADNAGVFNPYWAANVFFNHEIVENLFVEVALSRQSQTRYISRWFFDAINVDVNEFLPNGSPNPGLKKKYGEGRYWQDNQSNEVYDVRATLAYLWENDWTKQRFLVAGGYRHDRFEAENMEVRRTNGSNPDVTNNANLIFVRRYEDMLGVNVNPPPLSDSVSGIQSRVVRTNFLFSEKPITYGQAALNSKWFSDKLVTLAGVRFDMYEEYENDRTAAGLAKVRDAVSKEYLGLSDKVKRREKEIMTNTFSAVYHPFKMVSLFANYSESFSPGTTATDINGSTLDPLLSEGMDFGLKLNLFDGKLTGSVTYYTVEQENSRQGGQQSFINNIWTILKQDGRVLPSYQDRQGFKGTGWEFDFTAMPTENWRILFNFSIPETEIIDGMVDTRNYLEANRAEWVQGANDLQAAGDTAGADNIRTNITNLENAIVSNSTVGRSRDGTFDYTANIFLRYYFTEGMVKGFNLGGGANFRGQRLVANLPGKPYDYVYADSYETFSLVAGYERDIGKEKLTLQVNVSNLFDDEIVRENSYASFKLADGTTAFLPNRFTVQDPLNVRVSVGYEF